MQCLGFVNEILSGRSPDIFKKYFVLKHNKNYNLRRKGHVDVPPCRLQTGDKAVRILGASKWNELAECMLQHRLKNCLKKRLSEHYISKYSL